MALFVDQIGMTPLQALQTATVNAADYLQRTDLGRLEVGTQADIVLLEKNPLTNIRNTRTISTVILGGKAIPMTYHANFAPLIMRPIMPHSRVFYGQELLKKE
jgi:imidazolonepropionase-like amidohydrolase